MVGQLPRSPVTTSAANCRLYGKLPAHGDFISRGFDQLSESAIDASLTQCLEDAQMHWAARFRETYLSAQPWLFASENGSAIVIPSIDKVGRIFPLYVAVLKSIVLQSLYDATIDAISKDKDADSLLETLEDATEVRTHSPEEPEGRWFCIDPAAPQLPRCWAEADMDLGEA